MISLMRTFLTVILLFVSARYSQAYPNFIGYGYQSCLTCHFNSSGGGALNDYGRAVWASEMTSKSIFHRNMTDEQMAEKSGFAGSWQLPWWVRPGVKYRGLYLVRDVGSQDSIDRWINMQEEVNAAFFLDRDQKTTIYGAYAFRPTPERYNRATYRGDKPNEWAIREYFVKWQYKENLFLFAGLMDKVFGIKNVDHTSFQRVKTQLTMEDQSESVKAFYIKDKFEITGQYFIGNIQQKGSLRPVGFTTHIDYLLDEKKALGASYLQQKNDYAKRNMYSFQYRSGLKREGDSFISEIGLVDETPTGGSSLKGLYSFFQNMNRLARGYFLLMNFETWKPNIESRNQESYRYGLGLLSFPWSRTEFRLDVYNYRTFNPAQTSPDTWIATSQIHFSF